MYKLSLQSIIYVIVLFYLIMLFILPNNQHLFHIFSEMFPSIDIIIIYYISTHRKLYYWQIFIIGIFIDQLYTTPIGLSSLTLLLAELCLRHISKWLFLKEYFTNLMVFCGYSFFVIFTKYFIITIFSKNHVEGISIFFYLVSTIFIYPAMYLILEKLISLPKKNVR